LFIGLTLALSRARFLARRLQRQVRSLHPICPVPRASPEVHDRNDDNLLGINAIQNTKWKPTQQPASDRSPNNPTYPWIFGDASHSTLDFGKKTTAKTLCLPLVILSRF
jgi:hypothetical protein